MVDDAVSWDKHAEVLLKDWRQRMAAALEAHYKLASGLRKNLMLGIPVVICSSVVWDQPVRHPD
jgi:hypothetical protein